MARKKNLAFTITTALFCVGMLPGGVMNLIQPQIAVDMAGTLGIPLALLSLVGVWKLLGVAALATPGFARVKEWAYAGFFFDLTGAAFLHLAAKDYGGVAVPLVLTGVLVASYLLRPGLKTAESDLPTGATATAS